MTNAKRPDGRGARRELVEVGINCSDITTLNRRGRGLSLKSIVIRDASKAILEDYILGVIEPDAWHRCINVEQAGFTSLQNVLNQWPGVGHE